MGLFNLFRKKRKIKIRRKKQNSKSSLKKRPNVEKIGILVEGLQAQINTVNIALKKHDDELTDHKKLISEHAEGLEKLEQKVSTVQINPPVKETIPIIRPVGIVNPSTAPVQTTSESAQKFDINRFSEQQKRILAVFFQDQGMALSYVDIARTLNKSPHTIKNQMREIKLKADLFDRTIGEQSRHRFKLKKDLRIEKYLNVG